MFNFSMTNAQRTKESHQLLLAALVSRSGREFQIF